MLQDIDCMLLFFGVCVCVTKSDLDGMCAEEVDGPDKAVNHPERTYYTFISLTEFENSCKTMQQVHAFWAFSEQ